MARVCSVIVGLCCLFSCLIPVCNSFDTTSVGYDVISDLEKLNQYYVLIRKIWQLENTSQKSLSTELMQSNDDNSLSDYIDVPDDHIRELAKKNNITQFRVNYYNFYNSTAVVDPELVSFYWESYKNLRINAMLSRSHRREIIVELKFDFPFYGHPVRNVTISTFGFLYIGEYHGKNVYSWLATTQYIAPLMAKFDTFQSDNSFVRFDDNGTAFTVLWQNVTLQHREELGQFTFSVTLHDTGDIVFVYYSLPIDIVTIRDDRHPMKIGVSDGYIVDETIFVARRKTIYEYHRVYFEGQGVTNNTVITITANPTCQSLTDCEKCVNSEIQLNFKCYWCPTLNKCARGIDRRRQDWWKNACDRTQISEANNCPSIGLKSNERQQGAETIQASNSDAIDLNQSSLYPPNASVPSSNFTKPYCYRQ